MSSKTVTPNALIGGPIRIPPGFPLKACGNDSSLGEYGLEFLSGILRFILVHARKIMKSFRVAA